MRKKGNTPGHETKNRDLAELLAEYSDMLAKMEHHYKRRRTLYGLTDITNASSWLVPIIGIVSCEFATVLIKKADSSERLRAFGTLLYAVRGIGLSILILGTFIVLFSLFVSFSATFHRPLLAKMPERPPAYLTSRQLFCFCTETIFESARISKKHCAYEFTYSTDRDKTSGATIIQLYIRSVDPQYGKYLLTDNMGAHFKDNIRIQIKPEELKERFPFVWDKWAECPQGTVQHREQTIVLDLFRYSPATKACHTLGDDELLDALRDTIPSICRTIMREAVTESVTQALMTGCPVSKEYLQSEVDRLTSIYFAQEQESVKVA